MWSSRGRQLPAGWAATRQRIKKRAGGRCEWRHKDGMRCIFTGQECDHVEDNADHLDSNLRWLCKIHHQMHTQAQAAAARAKNPKNRPPETHPGRRS